MAKTPSRESGQWREQRGIGHYLCPGGRDPAPESASAARMRGRGPGTPWRHLEKTQKYIVRLLCYTLGGTPEPQQCTLGYYARYLIDEALFQQSPGPAARPLGGVTGLFCTGLFCTVFDY